MCLLPAKISLVEARGAKFDAHVSAKHTQKHYIYCAPPKRVPGAAWNNLSERAREIFIIQWSLSMEPPNAALNALLSSNKDCSLQQNSAIHSRHQNKKAVTAE
ncbi:unnamed protein product [Kuraishia capsulata CBS 1993]|uniref:Uncharacterized protein n=1 Tax=Kuraishia capsulata CBS 1993 TaxID=1382522 RepID=W6MMH3_9ASCO|nr:uncharacterized protein KUCA_T00002098001 [Kuraishia capsulata CBS 1993]CDK26127.1 unnamed protein product [Kuraishia capsulata CBS 1993]